MGVDWILGLDRIRRAARASDDGQRCMVSPSPDLSARLRTELEAATALLEARQPGLASRLMIDPRERFGFNDGLNKPGREMALSAPPQARRDNALESDHLRGALHVAVVLVDFPDKPFADPTAIHDRFSDLFFSKGKIPTGSVREYFDEVTRGAVQIVGDVVGPFRLPHGIAHYANGASGTGEHSPTARDMASDTVRLAKAAFAWASYDNDADGYVDAFVIVHAGMGGEVTGDPNDIWSHKWVLPHDAVSVAPGASIYAYLTVPEDARLGVCAHELGHLLFGFPDLYDTSDRTEGVGNWCLMGGGSWLGGGDTPAHPSAWCKCKQGWARAVSVRRNGERRLPDVKNDGEVLRLWKDGGGGTEYFLVESRFRNGFDARLPGEGLLIWHIDDSVVGNSNPRLQRVALEQADGRNDLERRTNRGDAGDPWPGELERTRWDSDTGPDSRSNGGNRTEVFVKDIRLANGVAEAYFGVSKE